MPDPDIHSVDLDSPIEVRSLAKRELDVRLVPWDRVIETKSGREKFTRGAFDDSPLDEVRLMGLEHSARMGVGQDGKPVLMRVPVGKAKAIESRDDAAYATFRVAKTQDGDEVLELAAEGLVSGVSIEFSEVPGGTRVETIDRRRTSVHDRVLLRGASTTHRPAYPEAAVLAVRTQETPVAEQTQPEAASPAYDITPLTAAVEKMAAVNERMEAAIQARSAPDPAYDALMEKIGGIEEQMRSSFSIPSKPEEPESHFGSGDWMHLVLRMLSGETVRSDEVQARVAAELITTDNIGVVPTVVLNEIIGTINVARPFLQSTRQLTPPRNGRTFEIPRIVTRPTVGIQAAEKDELTSTATAIDTASFTPITIGGYGDISIQLLKMSDPSYLDLYVDLLAEAYAVMADDKAIDALLAEASVNEGGTIDPNDGPQFGVAWENAIAISPTLAPDTVWMSSNAIAEFIDAKSDTTNAPLYANLAGNFTAAGGPGGTISGLRPVHVPALNNEEVDVIVGPSRGFAWSELGTFTLQVDIPAKAGRDVALVGMIWNMPIYPAAFTSFNVTGS